MLLVLLDTGIRASELCGLRIQDVNLTCREMLVFGKGAKERTVPFSHHTAEAINEVVTARRSNALPSAPMFITREGVALNRHALGLIIRRVGRRASVSNAHPHRFRHTFAISFLRNGGNMYALKEILGHSSMEMVLRYLEISQSDLGASLQLRAQTFQGNAYAAKGSA
jgi:site-specific recombinase XerD